MEKVKFDIQKGKATITEGGDTALGKLLANHKGKIRFNTPRTKGEFEIAKKE